MTPRQQAEAMAGNVAGELRLLQSHAFRHGYYALSAQQIKTVLNTELNLTKLIADARKYRAIKRRAARITKTAAVPCCIHSIRLDDNCPDCKRMNIDLRTPWPVNPRKPI